MNNTQGQWRTIAQDIQARDAVRRQRAIGQALKRIFEDAANEPTPQVFLDLLRRIDARSSNGELRYDQQ